MQLRLGHLMIHTVSRSRVGVARPHAIEDVGARPLRASLVGQCEVQESNGPARIRFAAKNWAYADVVKDLSALATGPTQPTGRPQPVARGHGGPTATTAEQVVADVVLYLEALTLTLLVEVPIYCVLLTVFARIPLPRALAAAIIVNLVSHPLFTAVLVPIAQRVVAPVAAVLIGEVIVCALEAGMLIAWLRRGPLVVIAVTLIANGYSFAAGLLWFSTVQPFP